MTHDKEEKWKIGGVRAKRREKRQQYSTAVLFALMPHLTKT